jgi:hypothetical protein
MRFATRDDDMSKQTGPYPTHIDTYTHPRNPPLPLKKRGSARGRWSMLILLLFLLIVVILPYGILRIWQTPYYQPLQAGMRVARVHATATGTLNVMNVELTLYKPDGLISYHHTSLIKGEKWMLREVVIVYPSWTGLPSGYKIVQLAGYDGKNIYPPVKDKEGGRLNGGEDVFYSFLHGQSRLLPFIQATDYKVYMKPGARPQGITYDIRLSADGRIQAQQLEKSA